MKRKKKRTQPNEDAIEEWKYIVLLLTQFPFSFFFINLFFTFFDFLPDERLSFGVVFCSATNKKIKGLIEQRKKRRTCIEHLGNTGRQIHRKYFIYLYSIWFSCHMFFPGLQSIQFKRMSNAYSYSVLDFLQGHTTLGVGNCIFHI